MEKQELMDFFEYHAISIRKFLVDNYDGDFKIKRKENGQKWRIKHSEIINLPYIVPISVKFSIRYIELVKRGYILIIQDEFGKYSAYLNPRFIKKVVLEEELLEKLKTNSKPFNNLKEIEIRMAEKKYLQEKINQIEEVKRIAKHFHGEDALEYSMNLEKSYKKALKK